MASQFPPKRATAFTVPPFGIYSLDGTAITGLTLTCTISKDGGSFASCANSAAEVGSTGMYTLVLSSTEMTADYVTVKVVASGYATVQIQLYTTRSLWNDVFDASNQVIIGTNNDKTGYALSSTERNAVADALLGRSLGSESYATDGAVPTLAQFCFMLWSLLAERSVSGVTLTTKKLDGTTTAMQFTLDSATVPTVQSRTT